MRKISAIIIVLMATANLLAGWTWSPLENVGNLSSMYPVVFEDSTGSTIVSYIYTEIQEQIGYCQVKDNNSNSFGEKMSLGNRAYLKKHLNVNGEDKLFFLQEKTNLIGEFEIYYKIWNTESQTFGDRILIADATQISSSANIDVIKFGSSVYTVWDNEFITDSEAESRIAISVDGAPLQFLTEVGDYAVKPQFFIKNNVLYLAYQKNDVLILRKITSSIGPEINTGKFIYDFTVSLDGKNMACVDADIKLENYKINDNLTFQYLYDIGNDCIYFKFFSLDNQNYIIYQKDNNYAFGLLSTSFVPKETIVNGFITGIMDIFVKSNIVHVVFLSYELPVSGGMTATVKYTRGESPSSIVDSEMIPNNVNLTNYPNPFNPTTTIDFSLPSNSKVELSVYNANGEQIKQLVNTELSSGAHSVTFDASNLNSGIYFYKLNTPENSTTKKMILVK